MKSVVVLLLFIGVTTVAFWFVWMNRASEKIVSSTLPIAIAAVVGVFLAGWVFGGEEDYETVFPVCYMLDLESKLPLASVDEMNKLPTDNAMIFRSHRFTFGKSPVPELKRQSPELFTDATKSDFCRNIYHHLLQRSLIDFLAMVYMGSWKAEPLFFNVGSMGFGRYGGAPSGGAPLGQTVLGTVDIEKILNGNWFSRIHPLPSLHLCLPPNTKIAVRVPSGGSDAEEKGEICIRNRFCTITMSTETAFAVRTIGEYRVMTGLSDTQAYHLATNMYFLRVRIHYTRWLSGHPEMKAYRQWAKQLVNETKNQFDEELIWARVKDDDLRSHLHPPEPIRERLQRLNIENKKQHEKQ